MKYHHMFDDDPTWDHSSILHTLHRKFLVYRIDHVKNGYYRSWYNNL